MLGRRAADAIVRASGMEPRAGAPSWNTSLTSTPRAMSPARAASMSDTTR